MDGNPTMYDHFSHVASSYRQIRQTDTEPILFISEILKNFPHVHAADVGCGAGRYDLLLFQHVKNLHLTCIDLNESMLQQVAAYLTHHHVSQFETLRANGNEIPLGKRSMDCVLTFNAVHHFDLVGFLENAVRVSKPGGKIFIYTRLRSQNARNVWGRHFPSFTEKETRLYEKDELEAAIRAVEGVRLERVKPFHYQRKATIAQLVERVRARHYSTFSLYAAEELNNALEVFQAKLKRSFHETVEWVDENTLLVLDRGNGSSGRWP